MSKKKIIIFTSTGGSGHMSATHALTSYLQDTYDIQPIHVFRDILNGIDLARYLSFGKFNGETIYNYFLNKKWFWLVRPMYLFARYSFFYGRKRLTRTMTNYLAAEKPDLVISVIPLINGITHDATKALGIPFLLIPTDLDVTTFIADFDNLDHPHFTYGLSFDEPAIKQAMAPAHIPESHIALTGFVLREGFFNPKDNALIKQKFNIPTDVPVIVLMMGGQGSTTILDYCKQLACLAAPVHVIICIGKYTQLMSEIQKITFVPMVTITAGSFTDSVSDLMSIADIIITKSGSVSFCESLYMGKPMLLDATSCIVPWEQLNHALLKKYEWGYSITNINCVSQTLMSLLTDPEKYKKITSNIARFTKPRPDIEIPKLVDRILRSRSAQ